MSDNYPEYLNPFAEDLKPKKKSAIRNSFRELKENLRQSFRIKKKHDEQVTVRQKNDTFRRVAPVSYSGGQPVAFPRSRFRERISQPPQNIEKPGPNPFEQEEDAEKQTKLMSMRRRMKKRAPLPPKSLSSQNICDESLEVPGAGSHWSLTSVETDYSGNTYDTTPEKDENENRRNSMVEKFSDFNKNMDKLKDDTNNNVIRKEEEISNIPDLVISCPNDTAEENETKDTKSDCSETDEDTNLHVTDITNNMITVEDKKTDLDETKIITEEDIKTADEITEENTKTDLDQTRTTTEEDTKTDLDKDDEISEENLNKTNMITEENTKADERHTEGDTEIPFLYHENKSLYIAGSRDELNNSTEPNSYTGKVSLYINGSCDDLDISNNNTVGSKDITYENNNDDDVPIPKQRKNKLTKNILLGVSNVSL